MQEIAAHLWEGNPLRVQDVERWQVWQGWQGVATEHHSSLVLLPLFMPRLPARALFKEVKFCYTCLI